jgi:hypothetical protein
LKISVASKFNGFKKATKAFRKFSAFENILLLQSSCCNPTLTTSTEPFKNWQMDAQMGASYLTRQLSTN